MQTKNNNVTLTILLKIYHLYPSILKICLLKLGSFGLLWITKSLHVKYWMTHTIISASKLLKRPSLMNKIGNTIILEPIMVLATLVATLIDESVPTAFEALIDLIFSFFYLSEVCFSSLTYWICACVKTYY